ncbi:MAG: GNAT family N-acetyltransferase [Cyclobacteriaceae bacterium]|nr:GNAT family N-acetyltransferase [Cyclobacteriaceae bacterium]
MLFRKLQPEDFTECRKFFLDTRTNRYWKSVITDPEELAREWFAKQLWRYEHNRGGTNLLIHRESKKLIGWSGLLLQQVDGQEELEVAYSLFPEFWGQRLATEAARTCIDFAFENKLSSSLISIIHIHNQESMRVAVKNGMKLSATTVYADNPVNIFRINIMDTRPEADESIR